RADRPSDPTHERPSRTSPPRRIEENKCVRPFKAKIKRLKVVAIEDPGVSSDQPTLRTSPLLFRRGCPAWLPVLQVEVKQGQARSSRQRAREGGLPAPGE